MSGENANSENGDHYAEGAKSDSDPPKELSPIPGRDYSAYIKRSKLDKHRNRYQKQRHDRFDWSGRWIDAITLTLTGFAAGAAIWLAVDTSTALRDAREAAYQTRVQSGAALITSNRTSNSALKKAGEANRQARDANGKQYDAMLSQQGVMTAQLNAALYEQRPWVYSDISVGGPIYRNQSGGLTIQITFLFHNTGHLPALYVSPDVEGYLSGEGGVVGSQSARDRQRKRCSRQLQQPLAADQIGTTVFPGQAVAFGAGVGITAAEMEDVQSRVRERMPTATPVISPWIVGCVRYRSPDGALHQSGVALTIAMRKPGSSATFVLPVDSTEIDPRYLVVDPWIEGGTSYAN